MNRAKLNYFVDLLLAISFFLVFFTGLIKFLAVKFGIIFGWVDFRIINPVHDLSGVVMGLLVLVHLILHWGWIAAMTRSFFRRSQ
ncbi:DUF4405 domain-containing protein [Candidatus Woesearchaeota archaeon]|nr:DUF4405 domain-containing protein [Candidatus Woesearchaeota archaeon]